ncbi:MAG: hypothetical protein ACR65O_05465 [Methylomicrobium sp.]|jgi:hypothetical protein
MHKLFNMLAHSLPLKHRIKARMAQLNYMKIKRVIKQLLLPPIVLHARGE